MFFEFAPSDQSGAQSGFGERRYEWGKKQVRSMIVKPVKPVGNGQREQYNDPATGGNICCNLCLQTFALSPTEMGGFIVQDNFQMIHDPGKGRQ
jgi:hypothetical protein